MISNTELDYVVKYFKEIFNDNVFYCLNNDSTIVINSDSEIPDDTSNLMFNYNESTQTLHSFLIRL